MIEQLVEVRLPGNTKEEIVTNFNRIKDVLSRIGVVTKDRSLIQSVHILQKKGLYYVLHFKQLFGMDGRRCEMSEEDTQRLNRVIKLLLEWGLINSTTNYTPIDDNALSPLSRVVVIRRDKVFRGNLGEDLPHGMYRLKRKYALGKKKYSSYQ
jgi:hypothetical protein